MPEITIERVIVPKPHGGIKVMYQLALDGKHIQGSRHHSRKEAEAELAVMLKSTVWKNAQAFY